MLLLLARWLSTRRRLRRRNTSDWTKRTGRRYTLGETFKRKLEELSDLYASLPGEASAIKRRSVVRKVKEALEKCHNDQPLSAVVSTVLMRSRAYEELRGLMIAAGDWDAQLEDSHLVAASASLA